MDGVEISNTARSHVKWVPFECSQNLEGVALAFISFLLHVQLNFENLLAVNGEQFLIDS